MRAKSLSLGILWLSLAQIMVAVNIVMSKSLLSNLPVLIMMTIRFSIAAFVLIPLHWLSPDSKQPWHHYFTALNRKDWIFLVAQALSAGVLFNCLMLTGLHATDANVAGIITSALPAMIALFSWLFLKEHITFKKSLCILLATLGLMIIALDKFTTVGEEHTFIGDAIVFISLIPEAGYYILTKIHTPKLPVFLMSSLLNAINAVILIPIAFAQHCDMSLLGMNDWIILFILGVSAGLFYAFWLFGSQKVSGMLASLLTAIMPIATVLFAWIMLQEALNLHQTMGLAMVLLSIVMYARL